MSSVGKGPQPTRVVYALTTFTRASVFVIATYFGAPLSKSYTKHHQKCLKIVRFFCFAIGSGLCLEFAKAEESRREKSNTFYLKRKELRFAIDLVGRIVVLIKIAFCHFCFYDHRIPPRLHDYITHKKREALAPIAQSILSGERPMPVQIPPAVVVEDVTNG